MRKENSNACGGTKGQKALGSVDRTYYEHERELRSFRRGKSVKSTPRQRLLIQSLSNLFQKISSEDSSS